MVDSGTTDNLFTEFDRLRTDFLSSGAKREPMRLIQSPEQPEATILNRDGVSLVTALSEFNTVIQSLVELAKQFGPYVGFAGWLIQALYNRKIKQKVMIAQVIGLLRGQGLSECETPMLKKLAEQELIRLGLGKAKAEAGATQVVEALVRELPPKADDNDPVMAQQVLEHLRSLSAYSQCWEFKEKTYGGRVKVTLPDNNERRVQIHFGKRNAEGRPLVELVSVCGKIDKSCLEQVLRMNNNSREWLREFGASYTIGQGTDPQGNEATFAFIQCLKPIEEVTEAFLAKVLPYLASKANALDAELLPRRKH